MSKKQTLSKKSPSIPGFIFVKKHKDIFEYTLKSNGLTVLYKKIPNTGVVTTNITYKVGAKDEMAGETGLAHMLEHMLFKPTTHDLKQGIDSAAMHFERQTGASLNANTWKDRTTYHFTYPKEYIHRALQIEAERMKDIVFSDSEFLPERGNVLSEFDMNNGNPLFALSVQMVATAFHSHPYGHETIGFREDIEQYTVAKLERFYKTYYRPDNATLMVVGDIEQSDVFSKIRKIFEKIPTPKEPIPRHTVVEPSQEGVRYVHITRPTTTNILALGVKHAGFPSKEWIQTDILFDVLANGDDSILHQKLVDTGYASKVEAGMEPTGEENLGMLFITIASGHTHGELEEKVLNIIQNLSSKDIQLLVKKNIQKTLTDELFGRSSSLGIAMELTEYVAADALSEFYNTEATLTSILVKDLLQYRSRLFDKKNMTIGYFIGGK